MMYLIWWITFETFPNTDSNHISHDAPLICIERGDHKLYGHWNYKFFPIESPAVSDHFFNCYQTFCPNTKLLTHTNTSFEWLIQDLNILKLYP